jgi:hypothetical protein
VRCPFSVSFLLVSLPVAQSDASVHHFSLPQLTVSKVSVIELHETQLHFIWAHSAYVPAFACFLSVQVTADHFPGSDGMIRGNCLSVITVKPRNVKAS